MSETVEQLRNTYPEGARIRLTDDSVGTVRYVGEVTGHPGLWLGIEWDDCSRGRHNGTVDGRHYFAGCQPTGASMIRAGRVAVRLSLRHAIEQKYIHTAQHTVDNRLMAETQRKLHASIFEIVGMEKMREKLSHWDGLNVVSVEQSSVYMAGILTQLVNLRELHLTGSLISGWGTVADILRQVPTLQLLNLSENRLQSPTEHQIGEYRPHFAQLRAINLRACALDSWQQLEYVARMWPNVRQLSVQENGLRAIGAPPDTEQSFTRLESLDLSQNEITDFAEIINLGRMEALRTLNLAENRFERVLLPDCEADEFLDAFQGLVEINLKENPLVDDCETFNELDKLQGLTRLMYSVAEMGGGGRGAGGTRPGGGFESMFSNSVSRMTRLQQLNGMPLIAADRRGAEYDLWKAKGAQWMAADEAGRRQLGRQCRAYPRLVGKYGPPDICIVAPKVSNLITIHMQNDPGAAATGTSAADQLPVILSKRVSRKMSVQALQGIALKLLAPPGRNGSINTIPRLSYLDRSRADLKIEMDNLSKSLDYYSVQDGDAILVDW